MIKIRLMTRHNLNHVAFIGIPDFNPLPDVLVVGGRVFRRLENAGIDEFGYWRYEECFGYFTSASPLD